jgi:hypothetical protein
MFEIKELVFFRGAFESDIPVLGISKPKSKNKKFYPPRTTTILAQIFTGGKYYLIEYPEIGYPIKQFLSLEEVQNVKGIDSYKGRVLLVHENSISKTL